MSADRNYQIELTNDEAATLRRVMSRIGGCPLRSRRKHTDAIARKLDGYGVAEYRGDLIEGEIHFVDEFAITKPKRRKLSADRKVSQ